MYPVIYPSLEDDDVIDDDGAVSLGYTEEQEFLDKYGAYMEIIYILSNGDLLKFDEIINTNIHKFLFLGEYLLTKRKIENKKINKQKL